MASAHLATRHRTGGTAALSVGTRLHVTLAINGLHLEFVPAEVARMSDEAMGLRFRDLSDELRSRIEALVQDLIAPS